MKQVKTETNCPQKGFSRLRKRWRAINGKGLLLMLAAAGLLFPAGAVAEDADTKVYELGDVVVSTTRNEIPVSDAAQSVTVLTEEDIMRSPFERVEDIIRAVPGVYNTRHFGTQTSGVSNPITIRGVGGNRVLLLVDGVPQNDNFNNSIAWVAWGHIPKEAIERIEIVRGPTSAMYGSEGIGGVIHIITKKPDPERKTSIRAEGGTSDTWAGHGFHSQTFDRFGLLLAGGYEESDGFYMTENPADYEIKRHREAGKVMGKAAYDLDDRSRLELAALYYDHETGKGRNSSMMNSASTSIGSPIPVRPPAASASAGWPITMKRIKPRIRTVQRIITRPFYARKMPHRPPGERICRPQCRLPKGRC